MLYFPPGCKKEWLEDISIPIVITEGEKKAGALYRVSVYHATKDLSVELPADVKPQFIAIGLSGVWNWRGTVGKTQNASGSRVDVKGTIPDFELVEWKGRRVFVVFDTDAKTNQSVNNAREALRKELEGRGAIPILIDTPAVNKSKGIDDVLGIWEREHGTGTAVQKCLELMERGNARHESVGRLVPLPESTKVPPLDPLMIPEPLREHLTDIADRMQCLIEYPVIPAIIAISTLIGNRICVKPKLRDGWLCAPNLWGSIVGRPGVMKSPAVKEAIKPFRLIAEQEAAKYAEVRKEFELEQIYAEARKLDVKKRMKEGEEGKDKLINEMRDLEVEEPVELRLWTSDVTVEKLGVLLNENPNGILLWRDELTGWLRTLDSPGREKDRSFFLEGWDGLSSFAFDRIGRGTTHVRNMTLSLFGTIQPSKIEPYLRGAMDGTNDDGLIQRLQLLVYPDITPDYAYIDRIPKGVEMANMIFRRLFELKPQDVGAKLLTEDAGGHAFLQFDGKAQEFFIEWITDLERSIRGDEFECHSLTSHISKYRSLMPSLALIFHLIDRVSGKSQQTDISLENAQLAAMWCSFLSKHAEKLYGLALLSDFDLAREILKHITAGTLEKEFTARDVYSKNRKRLTKPEDVKKGLKILADYGYLDTIQLTTGGRPKEIYVVSEELK